MKGVETVLDIGFEFVLSLELEILKTKLPFLRTPVVSQFTDWLIRTFMMRLYSPARGEAIYLEIRWTKTNQVDELNKAVEELENIPNKNEKEVRDEIRKRARDLVRINF